MDLEPMTVGHLFALEAIGSPFMKADSQIFPQDLISATFICSMPAARAMRALNSALMRPFFWLWGFLARKLKFEDEVIRFIKYLEHSLDCPCLANLDPTARPASPGAPISWRALALLMGKFHLTEDQALQYPLARAHVLYATLGEAEGQFQITNEQQLSFWEKCKRADQLYFAN